MDLITTVKNAFIVSVVDKNNFSIAEILWGIVVDDETLRWRPGDYCCTSPIVAFDEENNRIITKSRSHYDINGLAEKMDIPISDLHLLRDGVSPRDIFSWNSNTCFSRSRFPITLEHFHAGLLWLLEMSEKDIWNLRLSERARLLNVDTVTINLWVGDIKNINLDVAADAVKRLSILLSINNTLLTMSPLDREDLAYSLFKNSGKFSEIEGMSIREYLLVNNSISQYRYVLGFLLRYIN